MEHTLLIKKFKNTLLDKENVKKKSGMYHQDFVMKIESNSTSNFKFLDFVKRLKETLSCESYPKKMNLLIFYSIF